MKNVRICLEVLPVAIALLAAAGCIKPAPTPLTPEKVPTAVTEAFKQSTGETKEIAASVAADCQGQDSVKAFSDLQALSHQTNLTPEQRAITARAFAGVFTKLRADSDNGDAAAQAAVNHYLSSK
jgi:hypothetical protein